MVLKIKRVYEDPADSDGHRILVDRLWPRGISKEKAKIDYRARELSPSDQLRKWYRHDPQKWDEFKSRYFSEIRDMDEKLNILKKYLDAGPVTFVFSSKEQKLNNATALKELIENL